MSQLVRLKRLREKLSYQPSTRHRVSGLSTWTFLMLTGLVCWRRIPGKDCWRVSACCARHSPSQRGGCQEVAYSPQWCTGDCCTGVPVSHLGLLCPSGWLLGGNTCPGTCGPGAAALVALVTAVRGGHQQLGSSIARMSIARKALMKR